MNKKTLTIGEVQSSLREGRTTATALAETHLAAIAAGDGEIGSFLTVTRERALAKAAQIDRLVEKGDPLPPLAGVPVGIKDVLMTAGERTTAGSKFLDKFVAPYDATAIARLRAAGAIPFGRTNMDEFAMGSSTENSAYQKTLNPWDAARIPGGSSGGSAAVVAATSTSFPGTCSSARPAPARPPRWSIAA